MGLVEAPPPGPAVLQDVHDVEQEVERDDHHRGLQPDRLPGEEIDPAGKKATTDLRQQGSSREAHCYAECVLERNLQCVREDAATQYRLCSPRP